MIGFRASRYLLLVALPDGLKAEAMQSALRDDHLDDVDIPASLRAMQRFASDNQCAEVERERDEP